MTSTMAWQWSSRSSWSRSRGGSRRPKWDWQADSEKEWECKKCGASNWSSRRSCRDCENSGRQVDSEDGKDGKARDTGRQTDSEEGDPKVNAAAKVVTLEEALEKLGDSPLLKTARQELEKELQRQRKLAKDTRSTATKLAQK